MSNLDTLHFANAATAAEVAEEVAANATTAMEAVARAVTVEGFGPPGR